MMVLNAKVGGDKGMDAAAIILCAGKGTRMNDDSQNKVCFDCAGTPTIKRIIGSSSLSLEYSTW